MLKCFARRWYSLFFASAACWTVGFGATAVQAQDCSCNSQPLSSGQETSGALSNKDIPTGEGGFFRDYCVTLQGGDQVAIDLLSEEFDTIVTLIASDGATVSENDDGPDGTTNSLLFARIKEAGTYIVRVRAFGETGGGKFNVKVTRLRPIE